MSSKIELSFSQVEEILDSIIQNKKLFKVNNTKDEEVWLLFSFPSALDKMIARAHRDKALREAELEGLPTLEEVEVLIDKKGLLSKEDSSRIEELERKIGAQKKLLEIYKVEGRKKQVEEALEEFEKEKRSIESKKNFYHYMSRERKAEEAMLEYLVWASTYDLDGTKFWNSFSSFEKENDLTLRWQVISKYTEVNSGLDVRTVRFLSRHTLWRIRYSSALKLGGNLFCNDLNSLTPDQVGLLYWSQFYQSIYEMLPSDAPSSEVVEDDAALDAFMERYFKRKEEERNEGKVNRGASRGKLNAWDRSDELIITPAHPEYQSIMYSEKRVKDKVNEGLSDVQITKKGFRG